MIILLYDCRPDTNSARERHHDRERDMNGRWRAIGVLIAAVSALLAAPVATSAQSPRSVRGVVFGDANGNGIRDAGERGLAGWTVYLDQNGNDRLDAGEASANTSESGEYALESSIAGKGSAAVVQRSDWDITSPKKVRFDVAGFVSVGSDPSVEKWHAQNLRLADLDGDGALDLITANREASGVCILWNTGGGVFEKAVHIPTGERERSDFLDVGDLDGDGDHDMIVGNGSYGRSGSVTVLLQTQPRKFVIDAQYKTLVGTRTVRLADFNADGRPDIATADPDGEERGLDSGSVSVLLNEGDGRFSQAVAYKTGPSPFGLVTGDWDGDGLVDIATANQSSTITILRNLGGGRFAEAVNIESIPIPRNMTTADIDGDGDLDLLVADRSGLSGESGGIGSAAVFRNDGKGNFQMSKRYPGGQITHSVETGDLDQDGDLDVVVAIFRRPDDEPNDRVMLLLNDGRGEFSESSVRYKVDRAQVQGSTYAGPTFAAVGDWDGDGDLDVAVSLRFADQIALLRNRLGTHDLASVAKGQTIDFGARRSPPDKGREVIDKGHENRR